MMQRSHGTSKEDGETSYNPSDYSPEVRELLEEALDGERDGKPFIPDELRGRIEPSQSGGDEGVRLPRAGRHKRTDGVRIMRGKGESGQPAQQGDYVKIVYEGKNIGYQKTGDDKGKAVILNDKDGIDQPSEYESNELGSHVPYKEWITWETWHG